MSEITKENLAKNFSSVSFLEFSAMCNVLSRTETIAKIVAHFKSQKTIESSAFAETCLMHNPDDPLTAMEVAVLFKLVNGSNSVVECESFIPLVNPSYARGEESQAVSLSAAMQVLISSDI